MLYFDELESFGLVETYLRVTLFLIRFPKSENPRCIGFLAVDFPAIPLVIGELGSENCLSIKIGFGLMCTTGGVSGAGGAGPDAELYTSGTRGKDKNRLRSSIYNSMSWSSFTSISSTQKNFPYFSKAIRSMGKFKRCLNIDSISNKFYLF